MHRVIRSAAWAVIAAAAVLVALTGCGATSAPGEPATAQMAHTGPHGALSVVLTPLGAQRVGVQSAAATAASGGRTVIPYSALLYQPNGASVVYTVTGPLTYTLATVRVTSMQGSRVYLTGLTPGTAVVTVGGEELLGVQDGVGVET